MAPPVTAVARWVRPACRCEGALGLVPSGGAQAERCSQGGCWPAYCLPVSLCYVPFAVVPCCRWCGFMAVSTLCRGCCFCLRMVLLLSLHGAAWCCTPRWMYVLHTGQARTLGQTSSCSAMLTHQVLQPGPVVPTVRYSSLYGRTLRNVAGFVHPHPSGTVLGLVLPSLRTIRIAIHPVHISILHEQLAPIRNT